jgi:hypothetical protein
MTAMTVDNVVFFAKAADGLLRLIGHRLQLEERRLELRFTQPEIDEIYRRLDEHDAA